MPRKPSPFKKNPLRLLAYSPLTVLSSMKIAPEFQFTSNYAQANFYSCSRSRASPWYTPACPFTKRHQLSLSAPARPRLNSHKIPCTHFHVEEPIEPSFISFTVLFLLLPTSFLPFARLNVMY
jgi:hypothetical protein